MSRQIKVTDQCYNDLDSIRARGETFSQVIESMLVARLQIFELLNVLEGSLKFAEWKHEQLEKAIRAAQRGDSSAVSHVQTG